MNRKEIQRAAVAIFCAVIFAGAAVDDRSTKAGPTNGQTGNGKRILNASIQIIMSVLPNPPAGSQANQKIDHNRIIASGIGSLIEEDGEVLIITHNHWGPALQEVSLVEFRDAENELLLRMFGFQFQALIRHQDKGTLILEVPDVAEAFFRSGTGRSNAQGVLVPRESGDAQRVRPGAIVEAAHRKGGNRDEIGVMQAVVHSTDQFKGLPIFRLRSTDGQRILQGDSGGGVWLNGRLVGNIWATLVLDSRSISNTAWRDAMLPGVVVSDTSLAAILDIEAAHD